MTPPTHTDDAVRAEPATPDCVIQDRMAGLSQQLGEQIKALCAYVHNVQAQAHVVTASANVVAASGNGSATSARNLEAALRQMRACAMEVVSATGQAHTTHAQLMARQVELDNLADLS